jgi:hypothetical protein
MDILRQKEFVTTLSNLIRAAMTPFFRLILRFTPVVDAWELIPDVPVRLSAFGLGSVRPFEYYFEGTFVTPISTVDDLCTWLRECVYESDLDQFGEADVWQHPVDFERSRRGDCDDHALWAWRRLIELGYDAQLFAGLAACSESQWEFHIWVVAELTPGRPLIVETSAKGPRPMLLPLNASRSQYRPFCSVDRQFHRYCYGGLLRHLQYEHLGRHHRVRTNASRDC